MGETKRFVSGERKKEGPQDSDLEYRYWIDFIRGNSLDKYGNIQIIKTWYVDKFIASDILIGT
jgi:hypothetical protein